MVRTGSSRTWRAVFPLRPSEVMDLYPYEASRPLARSRRIRLPFLRPGLPLPGQRAVRAVLVGVPVVLVLLLWSASFDYERLSGVGRADSPSFDAPPTKAMVAAIQKEQRQLKAALGRKALSGNYIVIDVTNNRLCIRNGDRLLLKAICSTGSGIRLSEGEAGRAWQFDTPHGMFKVRQKIEDPLWKKPDWAFVEEKKPVPTNPEDRLEPGMMGEYGLHFGNGYLIHGTLYERLLGRSVTHGCVRLGRSDLKAVYEASKIGTPIIIY